MNFSFNIQLFLFIVSLVDLIICLIPIVLGIAPLLGFQMAGNNINSAIESTEFKYSLIVSLSMSLPMAFELMLRVIINQNFRATSSVVGHNFAVLLSLVIPDSIALFYVIPYHAVGILSVVLRARLMFITWAFLSFMNRRIFNGWSPRLSALLHVVLCVSSLPPFYKVYCPPPVSFPLEIIIGYLGPLFSLYIMGRLCYRWVLFMRNETRDKDLSTELYLDNIYVCAYGVTMFCLIVLRLCYPNYAEWYQYNSTFLAGITLTSTVFYTIIIVFERRVLHRDSNLLLVSKLIK